MGSNDTDRLALSEPLVNGRSGEAYYARFQTALSEMAVECDVMLSDGTVPLQSPDTGKAMSTMLVHGHDSAWTGLYHKMHLFGPSGSGERYAEADTISAGGDAPELSADEVSLAVGICYDLRFPEFFRAQRPFDVLPLPATFTYAIGGTYWELLLCAHAVENQCYVITAVQGGEHKSSRHTFGHSITIDPWGEMLAVLPEGEGVVVTDSGGARLQSAHTRLPTLRHRLLRTIFWDHLKDCFLDDFRWLPLWPELRKLSIS